MQYATPPRTSPPPTAPKTHPKPHPAPPSGEAPPYHMGSLRHTLGSPEAANDFGPETVLGDSSAIVPTHSSTGGVSHKIQQLLNTLKRPRKNRRPVEEYYHDNEEAPGEHYISALHLLSKGFEGSLLAEIIRFCTHDPFAK